MRRLTILGVTVVVAVAFMLVVGWWQVDGPGAETSDSARPLALSGMDFDLIDHEGNDVGPYTLLGQPSLVFFGFTYCPDVCPTTLADISGWLDELGDDASRLNTIFITVDPERDTVVAMDEYVGYFHEAIRGWAGPLPEIEKAVSGFRASFEKVPTSDGYTINHTASVFLFDAEGRFVRMIDYHEPREFAVPKIRRAMDAGGEGAT